MDTSEEYIEMCRKAVEIQAQWMEDTREYGDVFAEILSNGYISTDLFYSCPDEDNLWFVHNPVWLPRQDQLQEIVNCKSFDCVRKIFYFWEMLRECPVWYLFESMEQLWLAFVMHEKYGKHWNGKDWVVEA